MTATSPLSEQFVAHGLYTCRHRQNVDRLLINKRDDDRLRWVFPESWLEPREKLYQRVDAGERANVLTCPTAATTEFELCHAVAHMFIQVTAGLGTA